MNSAINIQALQFGFDAARPVLDLDALTLERGERLFVYGPSGCGKSTLLGLIAGVHTVQQGRLEVLGEDLTRLSQRGRDTFRAARLGVIFQTFNLLPFLTVKANIELGCAFSKDRRAKAGDTSAAIADLLDGLGLDADLIDRPVTKLSIGQQQRVAVARALIGGPDLVIADEPTSALDTATRDRFIGLLIKACGQAGSALVFVSHDQGLSGHFDRSLDLQALNKAGQAA